ncbi:YggS family pyridoxal phosphate-dependent enzyme [Motiliproteus sp.]|uniref:YggS family pyridoxal phosphate-dependent enzyme n=1 Tax=Motiliproteus sp. TaxID=1898955 RepID=UPI003BAC6197
MSSIASNIASTLNLIRDAEQRSGRAAGSVGLLAVSKTKPVAMLREAYEAGQRDFGENYLQDALPKMEQLAELDICWHFIGPLQSNKTRAVAEKFDWFHALDRLKIARRLSEQRPADKAPLNVCLQINISDEQSKSGVAPDEAAELVTELVKLPGLKLRGLMAIPAADLDQAGQRNAFARMRQLFEQLQPQAPELDTLSMGMSGDLASAVAEGSTLVRIGTAIFGARDYARPQD